MELAVRAAGAIRKKTAFKRAEQARLPQLLAEEWERDKEQALVQADAGKTDFTWAFDRWHLEFKHFSPTIKDIQDALPQEIKDLRDNDGDEASVTVHFDHPITFNTVIEYHNLTHQLVETCKIGVPDFSKAELPAPTIPWSVEMQVPD